jgi:hypothetical protein
MTFFLWILAPLAVAAAATVLSILSVLRCSSVFQVVAGVLTLIGMGWSALVLLFIMTGAYPTFIPHIVIVIILPLPVLQLWGLRMRREGRADQAAEGAPR